ncbi:MAG: L-idonate 5-dehydrogenase, partial [Paracoccaceae bacterium]
MTLAIVAHGARDLRLEPRPAGDPDPTQVRVALARGGICGSDLHYYAHGGFGTVRLREPMVLGHEISGHIAALGSEVVGLREGDLVALSPSRPCGGCVECLRGLPMHCLNMRFYGSAMPMPHIQGAFRQEIIADPAHLVRAEGISPAMAAMAEPLAVCLHAVERAGPVMGRRVLVTGCGPIGCLVILALRRAGAAEIIATDIADGALGFAKQAGADVVINAASDPDALAPYTVGKGTMDLAIECSGSAPALATTIAALRPRGTLVQLGLGGDMNVPLQALTAK